MLYDLRATELVIAMEAIYNKLSLILRGGYGSVDYDCG